MTARTLRVWLPVIVLAFSPAVAYADAGTPLMLASVFHLLIGNVAIGIGEGLLLAFLFRQKRASCIVLMIAANYFSAWLGGVFLISTIMSTVRLDLCNAWSWLWCMVAVSFVITLLLEWPFVALCLRKCDGWFRKSIWGSLVVQSASYLILFGWYWAASGTSLYTDLTLVQPTVISFPKGTMLYYIGESNGDVYARDLGRMDTRKICRLKPSENREWLHLQESGSAPGHWDLVVGTPDASGPAVSVRVVAADLKVDVAEPSVALRPGGDVPRFQVADKSGWEFQFGWMAGNLHGENAKNGKRSYLSLDTPFLKWPVYCPTQLPSGQVVFQLGMDQVCVLDPNKQEIALLAKGRSPVITVKASPNKGGSPASHD